MVPDMTSGGRVSKTAARKGLTMVDADRIPGLRGGRTPAAALRALASTEDRQHALDAGFQMHLPKPMDIDVLFSAVARLAATRDA